MWVGIAPCRASGAAREGTSGAASDFGTVGAEASGACSSFSAAGVETSGSTFQVPEGAAGRKWQLGQDGISWEGAEQRNWRCEIQPPSGVHRNPLPLILPLPTESFEAPPPPTSELLL